MITKGHHYSQYKNISICCKHKQLQIRLLKLYLTKNPIILAKVDHQINRVSVKIHITGHHFENSSILKSKHITIF